MDLPGLRGGPLCERILREALGLFPELSGRSFEWRILPGWTNRNYLIACADGERFALRLSGPGAERLGIDRARERRILRLVGAIGPHVVRFVEPQGHLLTRWIDGSCRSPVSVERIARLLKRLHATSPPADTYSPPEICRNYLNCLGNPRELSDLVDAVARFEARGDRCVCHNDICPGNMIDTGDSLRLIDWEYAGANDPFFDLAPAAECTEAHSLLECYFGRVSEEDLAHLARARFAHALREALWWRMQQSNAPDYAAFIQDCAPRMDVAARLGQHAAAALTRARELLDQLPH